MAVGFAEAADLRDAKSIDDEIYASWMHYLRVTLGRDEEFAHQRAMADVTRERARAFVDQLKSNGWPLEGLSILDLGSGHGTLAIELALAGAQVTAVEPCDSWRATSQRRAELLGLDIRHSGADGANLPYEDGVFDACVSLQVLEHVENPSRVIKEIARVLRPGGYFYISAENYLSFSEQHYGVKWLPLLPKFIGAGYLRLRGRDPAFLRRHVTYTTWPSLALALLRNDLIDEEIQDAVQMPPSKLSGNARILNRLFTPLVGEEVARHYAVVIQNRRRFFRIGFQSLGKKGTSLAVAL